MKPSNKRADEKIAEKLAASAVASVMALAQAAGGGSSALGLHKREPQGLMTLSPWSSGRRAVCRLPESAASNGRERGLGEVAAAWFPDSVLLSCFFSVPLRLCGPVRDRALSA